MFSNQIRQRQKKLTTCFRSWSSLWKGSTKITGKRSFIEWLCWEKKLVRAKIHMVYDHVRWSCQYNMGSYYKIKNSVGSFVIGSLLLAEYVLICIYHVFSLGCEQITYLIGIKQKTLPMKKDLSRDMWRQDVIVWKSR